MIYSFFIQLYCRLLGFGRNLHHDESGGTDLVTAVGTAAAVALGIAIFKPFIIIAFEQGGGFLIDLILRAGQSGSS